MDFNLSEVQNLSSQKADVVSGAFLVLLAFSLEIIRLLVIRETFEVFRDFWLGACLASAVALLIVGLLFAVNRGLTSHYEHSARRALAIKFFKPYVEGERITHNALQSIEQAMELLLGFMPEKDEKGEDFVRRLSESLNVQLPPDIQVEESAN